MRHSCPFPVVTILSWHAWWQQPDGAESFSVQPSASLCTSVLSSEGDSNGWGTSCRLACPRQTCSVPVLQQRTVATLGILGITPCCPPSSCSTGVSSVPQPAALPLFCSSSASCVIESLHNSLSVPVNRLNVCCKPHRHFFFMLCSSLSCLVCFAVSNVFFVTVTWWVWTFVVECLCSCAFLLQCLSFAKIQFFFQKWKYTARFLGAADRI